MYNGKKIAVVLGGGGLKPFSSLPLFKFLKDNDIEIDLLVGCSGGAIVAALIGCGFPHDKILNDIVPLINKSLFKKNLRALLSFFNLPLGKMDQETAIFDPSLLKKIFREHFGDRKIEDCSPKTIFQATNYYTGLPHTIEKGDLTDATYASSALYPFFPPIEIDGDWLFDGGFSSPVPVLQTLRYNIDIIIVVDFVEKTQVNPKGALNTIMHIFSLLTKTVVSQQMALSIALHEAEVHFLKIEFEKSISIWQTELIPEILKTGEEALDKAKEELLKLIYA